MSQQPGAALRRVAVFTGAREAGDPRHESFAFGVGEELARRGIGVVYGGGGRGMMGALSSGALSAGGDVIGVIPRLMMEREWGRRDVTLHTVESMHERKALMVRLADAFIAVPGGLGTLEEIFEVWTWRSLGFHGKPVAFLNAHDFWTPLLEAIDGMAAHGFIETETVEDLVVGRTLDEVLEGIEQRLRAGHE